MAKPAEKPAQVPHESGVVPPAAGSVSLVVDLELLAADIAATADLAPSNENTAPASFITRTMMAALDWIARRNIRSSACGHGEFFETEDFPFAANLEHSWTLIRGEVARLMMRKDFAALTEASSDPLAVAQDRGWRTAPLLSYGFRSDALIAQCPETWRLLQGVPGLIGAMFSVLEPGRFLPPHRGPYNGLLRLHLGLIVPDEPAKVGIRVVDKIRPWDEGRALIFDDTLEHEVWNDSAQTPRRAASGFCPAAARARAAAELVGAAQRRVPAVHPRGTGPGALVGAPVLSRGPGDAAGGRLAACCVGVRSECGAGEWVSG